MSTDLQVLVETTPDGFRATASAPFNVSAEAGSRDGALAMLRNRIQERIASGAEFVTLTLDGVDFLQKFAGCLPEDELTEQWRAAMREYRQQIERDDDA